MPGILAQCEDLEHYCRPTKLAVLDTKSPIGSISPMTKMSPIRQTITAADYSIVFDRSEMNEDDFVPDPEVAAALARGGGWVFSSDVDAASLTDIQYMIRSNGLLTSEGASSSFKSCKSLTYDNVPMKTPHSRYIGRWHKR